MHNSVGAYFLHIVKVNATAKLKMGTSQLEYAWNEILIETNFSSKSNCQHFD